MQVYKNFNFLEDVGSDLLFFTGSKGLPEKETQQYVGGDKQCTNKNSSVHLNYI